jgi:integrase
MEIATIDDAAPSIVNSPVVRTREYLTEREIERLMAAARKSSRYGHRDATMILIGYRHGLRGGQRVGGRVPLRPANKGLRRWS